MKQETSGWLVVKNDNEIHTIPVGGPVHDVSGTQCKCGPYRDLPSFPNHIIHHSSDGAEGLEFAQSVLRYTPTGEPK